MHKTNQTKQKEQPPSKTQPRTTFTLETKKVANIYLAIKCMEPLMDIGPYMICLFLYPVVL